MSKTKLLLDVVQDLRSLADSLKAVADAMAAPVPEEPAKAAEYSIPDETPEPPKPVTLEMVRKVLAEKSHAGYTADVKNLLRKYGADRLSQVDPDRYPDLLTDAEVIGDGA